MRILICITCCSFETSLKVSETISHVPLFICLFSDLFSCSMQDLCFRHMESLVMARELQQLQHVGLVAPRHMGP